MLSLANTWDSAFTEPPPASDLPSAAVIIFISICGSEGSDPALFFKWPLGIFFSCRIGQGTWQNNPRLDKLSDSCCSAKYFHSLRTTPPVLGDWEMFLPFIRAWCQLLSSLYIYDNNTLSSFCLGHAKRDCPSVTSP